MTVARRAAVAAMLRARSIAVVGASARPDSFGARMVAEVTRGDADVTLVNPRYHEIDGRPCLPSLTQLDTPPDLVLLGVGDQALEEQLRDAAKLGARSAVVFGSAVGQRLRHSLRDIAADADMALCGAGCMGFVNVADGVRAIGYLEREQLPAGPITLVTHSGSVFSALLRTRRALGYTLAVSSGQELVTTTADYLDFALGETDTRVVALVLETVRDGARLVEELLRARERGIPVVLLPVGGSALGSALVSAHSGALAGTRGMWEALAEGTGASLVDDLAELTDTLELFAIGRRTRRGGGIATVHDSGAERTLTADLAETLDVPFAPLSQHTLARLDALLDDGLVATNPLDLWGTGAATRELFAKSLQAMADDPSVSVVALGVDLVPEYDGDTSYPDAALDVRSEAPLVVLANLASAIDQAQADRLRAQGIPVLEGTRSGLVALRNLLHLEAPAPTRPPSVIDVARRGRWLARLADPQPFDATESFALLSDYGITTVAVRDAASADVAVAAARVIGHPVVLKTDEPGVAHKSDVGGVVLDLADDAAVRAAYDRLATRLGPRVVVCGTGAPGVELSVGMVRDPQLGPLVVVAAGGVLTELLADRVVALPPVDAVRAARLVARLRLRTMLDGWRGTPPADLDAVAGAIVAVSSIAVELGDRLAAVDVNPLLCSASGAIAVDALVEPA